MKQSETIFELENLGLVEQSRIILAGIDLKVQSGDVIGICGPSGSGKTSLLHLMGQLRAHQSGSIRFLGETIKDFRHLSKEHRTKIALVFQDYNLFPHLTILENCVLSPTKVLKRKLVEVEQQAIELLDQVQLLPCANRYPHEVSGGQRQRAGIVRSLMLKPEILLMDEPTSALDPEMMIEVMQLIETLSRKGMTMVIATHDLYFAKKVSTRMLFIDEGRLLENAPTNDFFTRPKTNRLKRFLDNMMWHSG